MKYFTVTYITDNSIVASYRYKTVFTSDVISAINMVLQSDSKVFEIISVEPEDTP